jgi:hypothetical protein
VQELDLRRNIPKSRLFLKSVNNEPDRNRFLMVYFFVYLTFCDSILIACRNVEARPNFMFYFSSLPTFSERGCRVVSVTDPQCRKSRFPRLGAATFPFK